MATTKSGKEIERNSVPLWPTNTRSSKVNVSNPERMVSVLGGGWLTIYGLTRGSLPGMAVAAVGADLIYRGVTGNCKLYEALNFNTAATHKGNPAASVNASQSVKVKRSMTINRSPEELYRFWRNFENLPHFMEHLEAVRVLDGNRSHWVAKAPAGTKVEWEAEIINEKPNELIAWRSLEGSQIKNAGSVEFKPATNGFGTEVKVEIDYEPPAGAVGTLIAKLFGEEPNQQVQEDLRHFKQLMEAGEIPTTKGQSTCRHS